jgi:hypothetical protein
MANRDDEQKYKDVIGTLKGLQKVNAPAHFETDLMRKINSEDFETEKDISQGWLGKFLIPSRWLPSAALALSAVVLLFILNTNNSDAEDPLSIEPKIRLDVIETEDISEIQLNKSDNDNIKRQRSEESSRSNIPEPGDENFDIRTQEDKRDLSFSTADFLIDKRGLNFRQVNLSTDEKAKLTELRERFTKLLRSSQGN